MKKLLVTLFVALIATGSQAWDQRQPLPPEQCKYIVHLVLQIVQRNIRPFVVKHILWRMMLQQRFPHM